MAVIDEDAVGQEVFTVLRTLILANLPTYTYDGATQTYSLKAEFSRDNPSFPQVVLNDSKVGIFLLNLDGSGEDYGIEVQLDFYARERHGKKAVAAGKDGLRATFIGNRTNFDTNNGLVPQEEFWDDSTISTFEDKGQVINTASVIIRFMLK